MIYDQSSRTFFYCSTHLRNSNFEFFVKNYLEKKFEKKNLIWLIARSGVCDVGTVDGRR